MAEQERMDAVFYRLVQQEGVSYIHPNMLKRQATSGGHHAVVVWAYPSGLSAHARSRIRFLSKDLEAIKTCVKSLSRKEPELMKEAQDLVSRLSLVDDLQCPGMSKILADRLMRMLTTGRAAGHSSEQRQQTTALFLDETGKVAEYNNKRGEVFVERWFKVGQWVVSRTTLRAALLRRHKKYGGEQLNTKISQSVDILRLAKPLTSHDAIKTHELTPLQRNIIGRSAQSPMEEIYSSGKSADLREARWASSHAPVKILPWTLPSILCITLRPGYKLDSPALAMDADWARSGDYLIPWEIVRQYRKIQKPRRLAVPNRLNSMLGKAKEYLRKV